MAATEGGVCGGAGGYDNDRKVWIMRCLVAEQFAMLAARPARSPLTSSMCNSGEALPCRIITQEEANLVCGIVGILTREIRTVCTNCGSGSSQ